MDHRCNNRVCALVLALTVLSLASGCASRGNAQSTTEPAKEASTDSAVAPVPTAAEQAVERVAYGAFGAAVGALSGFAVAASLANGEPHGTLYVSYATVPLFAFAGMRKGFTNGAAGVDKLPSPLLALQAVLRPRRK